jgi:hypothetical protein
MNLNPFTILPSTRYSSPSEMPVLERDGFVDDSVVQAILAGPVAPRQTWNPEDLVLAADEMDFAGWQHTNRVPDFEKAQAALPLEPQPRRAAPPVLEEPGLGAPHRGTHRWWIAGLAGAFSMLLFSLLLFSLSQHEKLEAEGLSTTPLPASLQETPVPKAGETAEGPDISGVVIKE